MRHPHFSNLHLHSSLNHLRAILFLTAAWLILSACSALQVISDTSPFDHYTLTPAIAYGSAARQKLDLYEPVTLKPGAPTVVFFYGGGWRDGERAQYQFVASALTEAGFRVIIPDYRLYPEVRFPDFVNDGAAAVAWAVSNAPGNGGAREGVYLVGHSAGAHIAALLATDPDYLNAESVQLDEILGLVGLSGPYDFLPIKSGYLLDVFPADSREASQPVNFVNSKAPPTLLIHGEDDEIVEPGNSERFGAGLREAGVPVTIEYYAGTGHAAVAAALAPQLTFVADTLDDTIAFIKALDESTRQR